MTLCTIFQLEAWENGINWADLYELPVSFGRCNQKEIRDAHLLKLLDKMCKYERDLATIVEDM